MSGKGNAPSKLWGTGKASGPPWRRVGFVGAPPASGSEPEPRRPPPSSAGRRRALAGPGLPGSVCGAAGPRLGAVVTRWLPTGYPAVTHWLPGGYPLVTQRLPTGYLAVTWQIPCGTSPQPEVLPSVSRPHDSPEGCNAPTGPAVPEAPDRAPGTSVPARSLLGSSSRGPLPKPTLLPGQGCRSPGGLGSLGCPGPVSRLLPRPPRSPQASPHRLPRGFPPVFGLQRSVPGRASAAQRAALQLTSASPQKSFLLLWFSKRRLSAQSGRALCP